MATIIKTNGMIETSSLVVEEGTNSFNLADVQREINAHDTRLVFTDLGHGRVLVSGHYPQGGGDEEGRINDVATTICRHVGDVSSIVRGDALVCDESEVSYY